MSFNNYAVANVMSVRKFDENERNLKALASDPRTEGMYTSLDVYIPRIDSRYTEEDVKRNFQLLNVGIVQYVDFVATKCEETKEVKFFSAFIRFYEWNKISPTFVEFKIRQQSKLYITNSEFWFLFPAKNTVSRSKVNTSQLATYMDELFERVEKSEENMSISSTHFNNLLAKSEQQAAQIEQLLKIVKEQSTQLTRINDYLLKKEDYEEQVPEKKRSLTIEDNNFAPELAQVLTTPENNSPVYCDDECFFLKPLNITDTTKQINREKPKKDIVSGRFSFNLEDVLGPVAKSMGITKEQAREGIQKEVQNCSRVKNSNSFCGNA